MKSNIIDWLKNNLSPQALQLDVPYSKLTTLGAGKTAPVTVEVADDIELSKLLKFTYDHKIAIFPLGGGSNLVGADDPVDAIFIRLNRQTFGQVKSGRSHVSAGAAIRLPELARQAAALGFGGLAPLSGIPGSLGGAILMNAGANNENFGRFCVQLFGCKYDGSAWCVDGDKVDWQYRKSSIPEDVIITGAILRLPGSDEQIELAKIAQEWDKRKSREPAGRSAGCTFKNISENEPAGKLIDRCGLKGYSINGFMVSLEHANFIVNTANGGSEEDYLELLMHIRRMVAEHTGFFLTPEVKFVNPKSLAKLLSDCPAPRVNVLKGGTSSEREVSLRSGAAVAKALTNAGFEVIESDIKECAILPEMKTVDVVYPVLHGGFGEDGRLQALLEAENLRFVGSGSVSSMLIMDKIATKQLADRFNIPTAKWAVVTPQNRAFPKELKFPVVVKAPKEGSTVGIMVVKDASEWDNALVEEFKHDSTILVEEFITGVEITVPLVNGVVLPAIEIRSPHGFYDYDAKYVYKDGKTEYFCPVQSLDENTIKTASAYALKFHLATRARDILRVDFIVDANNVPFLLEGNSLPGCTATSLVPKAARQSGISFEKMTSQLVYAAMMRRETK